LTSDRSQRTISVVDISSADRRGDTVGAKVSGPDGSLPLPTATLHILVALGGTEKHGYAIMRDVAEVSGGAVRMGSGTLYGSIRRMLEQGLIEEADERPDPALDDQRRRYYRLTARGQRVGAAEQARLAALVDVARLRRLGLGGAW
jgi:DNA-binding PadR family transcriptional regulator